MVDRVIAATDGAAQPNPGPAAWAWVVADTDDTPGRGESGYLGESTNNVGELTAVAQLLQATDPSVPLEIRIDSQYALKAVTEWLPKQRQRGYKTAKGDPIKNRDLIVHIDELLTDRDVTFTWVRAHQVDGDVLNAHADRAAEQAVRDRQGLSWTGSAPATATSQSERSTTNQPTGSRSSEGHTTPRRKKETGTSGKPGSVGRRSDGRYLVEARHEQPCDTCRTPILTGALIVRDDFGQWVHTECQP